MPVRVAMARPVDAGGLIGALAAHGLSGELVDADGLLEIEVQSEPGEGERLAAEVADALEAWLLERELPFIPLRVGADAFALAPPGD